MITKHCVACNNTDNLHNHHLLPKCLGGGDEETNMVTLCVSCHGKVHGEDGMKVIRKEREMISTRTKAALAVLKAQGVVLGNQTNLDEARLLSNATNKEQASKFADVVLPTVLQFRNQGDTLPVIADKLNNMGVKTRRGGKWYASTVTNILNRA